jgi:hypothetical protein
VPIRDRQCLNMNQENCAQWSCAEEESGEGAEGAGLLGFNVLDLHRVWQIQGVLEIDGYDQAPPGPTGLGHMRTKLHQEERGRFGGGMPPAEFGEGMHLLQQLH